jgi:hypothetical protein
MISQNKASGGNSKCENENENENENNTKTLVEDSVADRHSHHISTKEPAESLPVPRLCRESFLANMMTAYHKMKIL